MVSRGAGSWARVAVWVAALAGGAGCAAGARESAPLDDGRSGSAARKAERWVEVRTPHFLVSTDLTRDRAVRTALQLEEARAMLLAAAWPKASDPRGRTRVVVFARPSDLDRYTGLHAAVAGVSINRVGVERTIAFSPGAAGGVPRVAVHELAHDLLSWFLPLQPAWLAEGMAVYLENTHLDGSSGQIVMGEASEDSLRWVKQTRFFMSAARLFAAGSPHSPDLQDVASFYAGSWLLVHFLLNEEPEAFGRFQKRLHQLVPWRRAWDEAFDGMTIEELDRRMTAYVQQGGRFVVLSVEARSPSIEPELRTLSPAEAHGVKALLASHAAPDMSVREQREALALDADELGALSAQFRATDVSALELRRGIAERAVAARPDAAEAWFLQALAATDAETRGHALGRAATLEPEHVGVALLSAQVALDRGDAAAALDQVRFAVRRSALSPGALALYVDALARTGRCSEAASVAENGDGLFGSRCRVQGPSDGEPFECSAYVQRARQGDLELCSPTPVASRASAGRPRRAQQPQATQP